MFDINIKKAAIKLYNNIKKQFNINGKDRINLIEETFNCNIKSLYVWKKENDDNHKNTYKNINITPDIIEEIFNCVNILKLTSIDKIKKYINNKYNITLNYKTYAYILKINNLECENFKMKIYIENYVINEITNNKLITIKEIIKNIHNKFNVKISEKTIYNLLKKNNFSYKQVKIKTNPYTKEEQKESLERVKSVIDYINVDNICSYDEISAVSNKYPRRGWSKRGEECIIESKNTLYGKRFTIGLTVNTEKIINFNVVEGGMKKKDFIDLMTEFNKIHNNENDKTIFLDNASIHHSKDFKQYTKETKMHVLYNVPYNSDKNPVEYVFSLLRKVLERSEFTTINELTKIVNEFKNNLISNKLNNIFRHAFDLFNLN